MNNFLDSKNFPIKSASEDKSLAESLDKILKQDYKGSFFTLLSGYQRIFGNNKDRDKWEGVHEKLMVLFKCGKNVPLDGPMIGVSMSIRDSDYFKKTAELFGGTRSVLADIEWMATCWNMTFGNTGIWMGKTFEPVSKEKYAEKCGNNAEALSVYNTKTSRIGRNFFREPKNPNLLQRAGLPVLTKLWNLKERPMATKEKGFDCDLLEKNLLKEKNISYSKTGGYFLANPGKSVVDEMNGKPVYQLNYRWPSLGPVYPMTRLVDELVMVDEGIYLGQLVMATKHYSLGSIGESYDPAKTTNQDYGYQNNGFFLMIDPVYAEKAYDDKVFPELR